MTELQVATERLRRHTPSLPEATAAHLARKITRKMPNGEWTWCWDALHRCRNPQAFDAAAFRDFLVAIACPTLVIEGAQSKVKLEDRDARLKALAPEQVLLLEDAGHQIHHDAPHELSHAIQTFLDRE
jgi:pimeloyl-ACP methyl ester carboxylesterase